MGSVTIIIIIPLFLIFFAVSSVIGAVTGVDKTEVVLPYEPEKGIVWECDIQDGTPVELVETEIDGEKQIFYFKSNAIKDMIGIFAGLAKDLITKEPLDPAARVAMMARPERLLIRFITTISVKMISAKPIGKVAILSDTVAPAGPLTSTVPGMFGLLKETNSRLPSSEK